MLVGGQDRSVSALFFLFLPFFPFVSRGSLSHALLFCPAFKLEDTVKVLWKAGIKGEGVKGTAENPVLDHSMVPTRIRYCPGTVRGQMSCAP